MAAIDHTELRNSLNKPLAYNQINPAWQAAFLAYNLHHNHSERLNMTCLPCYSKVLAFMMNKNITQI